MEFQGPTPPAIPPDIKDTMGGVEELPFWAPIVAGLTARDTEKYKRNIQIPRQRFWFVEQVLICLRQSDNLGLRLDVGQSTRDWRSVPPTTDRGFRDRLL